jgi:hypothetical protein
LWCTSSPTPSTPTPSTPNTNKHLMIEKGELLSADDGAGITTTHLVV